MEQLKTYSESVRDSTREEYVEKYPDAVLMGLGTSSGTCRRAFQTMAGFQVAEEVAPGRETELAVHPIQKTERNSFGHMITLGRSDNNDVVIDHPSVSKFHAFFTKDAKGERYSISDADSRFGTFVEDHRLRPSKAQVLNSGETLAFGKGSKYGFYLPGDFYDYIKVLQGLGKI
ncbi:MAG: FHA domain-containing protein [Planctomycetota bacterium]|jgi:hypothetical protein